jgi:hypothetical protein
MSHSTVLVIGPEPEKQLEPFDEGIDVAPYKKRYTARDIEFAKEMGYDEKRTAAMYCNDCDGTGTLTCEQHGIDNEGPYYMSTYNPKSKWDWYSLGGRWEGTFILREGAAPQASSERSWVNGGVGVAANRCDSALKKDIDWSAMEHDGYVKAKARWDHYHDKNPVERTVIAGIPAEMTEEEYIKRHSRWSTFAVLKDGEWYERGTMGWFGVVADEKDADAWDEQFMKLLSDLPPDTLLSVYDVHI